MTYRLLEADEYQRMEPHMREHGFLMPDPQISAVAVAENEAGELQGFICLQLAVHMEPVVIINPHASYLKLQVILEEKLKDNKGLVYYAMIDTHRKAMMAQKAGLEETRYSIWKKEIQ